MIASEAVRFHTRVENFKFETEANATSLIAPKKTNLKFHSKITILDSENNFYS